MSESLSDPRDVEPFDIIGPSGAVYPIEPLRFAFGLSRVQTVDMHLGLIVTLDKGREDVDLLLDMRNEWSSAND